ncbi:phosphatidylserine decarboxylase [bacterium]|nr:phosphatidylserine decarboxylase [bacterium]
MEQIKYLNRESGQVETEQVYGEGFLRWAYGNPLGKLALHSFVKRPFFSKWYGRKMDQPKTAERVAPFLKTYGLGDEDFIKKPSEFTSFNDFFYRKLKPEARPLSKAPVVLPADGRHLGFAKASEIEGVFVKGQKFDVAGLLGSAELGKKYQNGPLLLSRLCPVDYHRFHFPCAGTPGETRVVNGPLFSVSPLALRQRLSYLWENKRTITELVTEDFGTVICMEIGATCVGTIEQTFTPGQPVEKGAEKGYFAFGGSSTLLLFEPGTVALDADLLESSAKQMELYAKVRTSAGSLTSD